jgi:hypothetical protein
VKVSNSQQKNLQTDITMNQTQKPESIRIFFFLQRHNNKKTAGTYTEGHYIPPTSGVHTITASISFLGPCTSCLLLCKASLFGIANIYLTQTFNHSFSAHYCHMNYFRFCVFFFHAAEYRSAHTAPWQPPLFSLQSLERAPTYIATTAQANFLTWLLGHMWGEVHRSTARNGEKVVRGRVTHCN